MRRLLTVVLVAVALLLGGCGSDDSDALDWSATDKPVGADAGLVWADRQTSDVHLADGTTLAADSQIRSFVAAGRGAFIVDKDNGSLVEVTPDGARKTGAHVDDGLRASPDGRYIAFIDPVAGPTSGGDVPVLVSVVVDLKTGKEVFRSTRGMGDPDKDDLEVLYENVSYGVLAVTDTTAWIQVAKGQVLAIDLSSGAVTTSPGGDVSDEKNPWVAPRLSRPTSGGPANADRTWAIYHVMKPILRFSDDPAITFPRDELEARDGARVVIRPPGAVTWRFQAWVDGRTVVGYADEGLDNPDRVKVTKDRSLTTCTVPEGVCTLVPGSGDAVLPEPSLS